MQSENKAVQWFLHLFNLFYFIYKKKHMDMNFWKVCNSRQKGGGNLGCKAWGCETGWVHVRTLKKKVSVGLFSTFHHPLASMKILVTLLRLLPHLLITFFHCELEMTHVGIYVELCSDSNPPFRIMPGLAICPQDSHWAATVGNVMN